MPTTLCSLMECSSQVNGTGLQQGHNCYWSNWIRCQSGGTLVFARRLLQFLQHPVEVKAPRLLSRREILVSRQVLRHKRLRRQHHEHMLDVPAVVGARFVVGPLKGVQEVARRGEPGRPGKWPAASPSPALGGP